MVKIKKDDYTIEVTANAVTKEYFKENFMDFFFEIIKNMVYERVEEVALATREEIQEVFKEEFKKIRKELFYSKAFKNQMANTIREMIKKIEEK